MFAFISVPHRLCQPTRFERWSLFPPQWCHRLAWPTCRFGPNKLAEHLSSFWGYRPASNRSHCTDGLGRKHLYRDREKDTYVEWRGLGGGGQSLQCLFCCFSFTKIKPIKVFMPERLNSHTHLCTQSSHEFILARKVNK